MKQKIDKIFEEAKDQYEAIMGLYRLVIPDFDTVKKVKGWPSAGRELSQYVWKRFINFDQIHHPDVMAGGLWMNNGFSEDKDLKGWQVNLGTCQIIR